MQSHLTRRREQPFHFQVKATVIGAVAPAGVNAVVAKEDYDGLRTHIETLLTAKGLEADLTTVLSKFVQIRDS